MMTFGVRLKNMISSLGGLVVMKGSIALLERTMKPSVLDAPSVFRWGSVQQLKRSTFT